jgi:ABC-type lipoprotein release transport system permease subunit
LLGATWPTLTALPAVPSRIVGGDAYAITQGTGALSINVTLAENITLQPSTKIVSPEILGLGTLAGEPVVVRAADPDIFRQIDGGTWVTRSPASDGFAILGDGLARRIGVGMNETVTLVGSFVPRIVFARITGIYRTESAANDELLVDYTMGRFLTGLGPRNFHSIRVRTTDPAALLSFLDGFGASVHVSGPGLSRADVHSDPPSDERLANLILRTGSGGAPRDYVSTAIGEATISVQVVAYGIAILLGVLVAFGVHGVQARAFADREAAIGVLRAVGASNGWMRRRLLVETVPFAFLAGLVGVGIGVLLGRLLQPSVSLVVFGHEVPISFDPLPFALMILVLVAISAGSALGLLRRALRARPAESIRESTAVEPPRSLEAILRG